MESSSEYSRRKKKSKFQKLQEQVDEETRNRWKEEQAELREKLIIEDDFDWYLPKKGQTDKPDKVKLERIGAVDVSYSKHDSQKAIAALVVLAYPSFDVLYEDYEIDTTDYPYIPGFLAFKEVPSLSVLFDRMKKKSPELWPQVLLVDGNGILHNRGFGAASHIGVVMDIPSIGVGKTVFAVDGITQNGVRDMSEEKLLKGGDLEYLVGKSGKVWGAAFRSTDDSKNPIIISIGHRICLETAINVVKSCIIGYRIPEPIRQADKRSRVWVQKSYDGFERKHKKAKDYEAHKSNYSDTYKAKDPHFSKTKSNELKTKTKIDEPSSKNEHDHTKSKPISKKKKEITDDDGWTVCG